MRFCRQQSLKFLRNISKKNYSIPAKVFCKNIEFRRIALQPYCRFIWKFWHATLQL